MKLFKTLALSSLFALSGLAFAEEPATTEQVTNPQATQQVVQNTTGAVMNKVNINNASAAELQDKLVNVGAKKAQAIVEWREKNGQFVRAEQLTEVSGIGPAILKQNQDRIVLE